MDYTPPPDATELGPNDYWAASGPMNVTCLAAGSTGPVTYQWSSTCRECPFFVSNPKNQSVIVPVVSSGYTGNATCLVMDGATGSTKSTHIELIVVGKYYCIAMAAYTVCMIGLAGQVSEKD